MIGLGIGLFIAARRALAAEAPTVTASAAMDGRTLRITRTDLTGSPYPSVTLTTLTLDTVDVSSDAVEVVAGRVWEYYVPPSALPQVVAWEITATNSESSDTASGSETVEASVYTAQLYPVAEGETLTLDPMRLAGWNATELSGVGQRETLAAVGRYQQPQRITEDTSTSFLWSYAGTLRAGHTYVVAMEFLPNANNRARIELGTAQATSPRRRRIDITFVGDVGGTQTFTESMVAGSTNPYTLSNLACVATTGGRFRFSATLVINAGVTATQDTWLRLSSGDSGSTAFDIYAGGIMLAQDSLPAGTSDGQVQGGEIAVIPDFWGLTGVERVDEIEGVTVQTVVDDTPGPASTAVNHAVKTVGSDSLVVGVSSDFDNLIVRPDTVGLHLDYDEWTDITIDGEIDATPASRTLRIHGSKVVGKDVLKGVTPSAGVYTPNDALRPGEIYEVSVAFTATGGTIIVSVGSESSMTHTVSTTGRIVTLVQAPAGATTVTVAVTGDVSVTRAICRRVLTADGAPATIEHVRTATEGSDLRVTLFAQPVDGWDFSVLDAAPQNGTDYDNRLSYDAANPVGWSDGGTLLRLWQTSDTVASREGDWGLRHYTVNGGGIVHRNQGSAGYTVLDVEVNATTDATLGNTFYGFQPYEKDDYPPEGSIPRLKYYYVRSDVRKVPGSLNSELLNSDGPRDAIIMDGHRAIYLGIHSQGWYETAGSDSKTAGWTSCSTLGNETAGRPTNSGYYGRHWHGFGVFHRCRFGPGQASRTSDFTTSAMCFIGVYGCEFTGVRVNDVSQMRNSTSVNTLGWSGSAAQVSPMWTMPLLPDDIRLRVTAWDVETSTDGGLTWTAADVPGGAGDCWGAPHWLVAGAAGRSVRARTRYGNVTGPWVYA